MLNIKMDMIQTVGLAVVILIIGRFLRKRVKFYDKNSKPKPVKGGLQFEKIN